MPNVPPPPPTTPPPPLPARTDGYNEWFWKPAAGAGWWWWCCCCWGACGGGTSCASTGFLERLRPRCMWRSQYLESGAASLEHRHFLPSVRRHLPGSGSSFLPKYVAYPTAQITQRKSDAVIRYLSIIYAFAFNHLPVRMHLGFAVSKWIGIWYRTVPMQAQGSASYS